MTGQVTRGSIEELAASVQDDFALFVKLANATQYLPKGGHLTVLLPDRNTLKLLALVPVMQEAPAPASASAVPLMSKTGIFFNSVLSHDLFQEAFARLIWSGVEWVKIKTGPGYWIRIFTSQTASYRGHEEGDLLLKELAVPFEFEFRPTETTITAYRIGYPIFASVDEPM